MLCVVNRLFRSPWLYLAMCVMELFVVFVGVQVLIESAIGAKTVLLILFFTMFLLTQLIALALVIIDLVIRIIRCS